MNWIRFRLSKIIRKDYFIIFKNKNNKYRIIHD